MKRGIFIVIIGELIGMLLHMGFGIQCPPLYWVLGALTGTMATAFYER